MPCAKLVNVKHNYVNLQSGKCETKFFSKVTVSWFMSPKEYFVVIWSRFL